MQGPVCIVMPPSSFLLDERGFPFLGVLKLPPILEQHGILSEVIDLSGLKNYLDVLRVHAAKTQATHFGITATTPQFPAAVQIARTLRQVRPDARVIIGGAHATLVVSGTKTERKQGRTGRAHRALRQLHDEFDVVVSGDGERTIMLALADNAPNLIDADDRMSPLFLKSGDGELESVFPARELIDLRSYRFFVDGEPATSMISQLGCPYKCGFCAGRASPMLRNIRTRSPESVVEEMLLIHRTWGYKGIMFYDDELNVSNEMVHLMELIAKAGRDNSIDWKLRGFIKSERFTDEQAEAMYEAGFKLVLIGFESGSPRILENIQKIATQADNTRCMDIARRSGLKVKALMSLGHPGESKATVEDTRQWLLDVQPADFDATVITPYPGSPYFDSGLPVSDGDRAVFVYTCKNGDRLFQEEVDYAANADYYKGIPGEYVSHVWTPDLAAEDLARLRDDLESDVRKRLNIPFNPTRTSLSYDHSMGQSPLPASILRRTAAALTTS